MRRSSLFRILLLSVLNAYLGPLRAQALQDFSSLGTANSAVIDETATIFFESYVGDLSIISTDEGPEEIIKIGPNIWRHRIDLKKDKEFDDYSYRNYIIHNSSSADCHLTTPVLDYGYKLYYKIFPKLTATLNYGKSKIDRSASDGIATIFFDCRIDNVTITPIDTLHDESVINVNDNLWFTHIDVKKNIKTDGTCNRNYLIESPYSTDFFIKADTISPNQVLYYTIATSNELVPQMIDYEVEMARNNKTATIFFESWAGDLNITSTEGNFEEIITKIGPNLWRHCVDVSKDLEIDDFSYRNYIINNSYSVECSLSTSLLNVGQNLYYKVLSKLKVEGSEGFDGSGTASIFFDSRINDLDIICINEGHKESIIKLSDNLSRIDIDVQKEMEKSGICNRKFLLRSPSSTDFILSTDLIRPDQALFYTITLSNELEAQLIDYPYPSMEK